jgi:hypothetical protein
VLPLESASHHIVCSFGCTSHQTYEYVYRLCQLYPMSFWWREGHPLFPHNICRYLPQNAILFHSVWRFQEVIFSVKTSGIWLFLQPECVVLMGAFYDPFLQPSSSQTNECVYVCVPTLRATLWPLTRPYILKHNISESSLNIWSCRSNKNNHMKNVEIKFLYGLLSEVSRLKYLNCGSVNTWLEINVI